MRNHLTYPETGSAWPSTQPGVLLTARARSRFLAGRWASPPSGRGREGDNHFTDDSKPATVSVVQGCAHPLPVRFWPVVRFTLGQGSWPGQVRNPVHRSGKSRRGAGVAYMLPTLTASAQPLPPLRPQLPTMPSTPHTDLLVAVLILMCLLLLAAVADRNDRNRRS